MIERFVAFLLVRPRLTLAGVIALTAASLALAAARVRPDFSVDSIVPAWDPVRQTYERYKADFPYADGRAIVIVEAPDIFSPEGISRVAALERDLDALPDVIETESIASVRDVVSAGPDELLSELLFPPGRLSPGELLRRRATATTDPVFAWRLASADGRATTIRAMLRLEADPRASTRERFLGRMRFLRDARAVIARHERPGQTLTLGGVPATRAEYAEMIGRDMARLFPIALAVVLVLLALTFGTLRDMAAALATIFASIAWTLGALAVTPYWDGAGVRFGAPLQVLTQVAPMIVMIISISDTVHVIAHYKERIGHGEGPEPALAAALSETALPCFLTEVVIAAGFLSLAACNIMAILQFGVVLALGMMLTWLANMTVLPLALRALRPRGAAPGGANTAAARAFRRFVLWVEGLVTARPGRVVAVAALVVAGGAACATRAEIGSFVYDDLRPSSPLGRRLAKATDLYGGTVPLAILIEPGEGARADAPFLDPEAIALADRAAGALRAAAPEARLVVSPADFFRKVHRLLVGEVEAAARPLPATRALAAQELALFDDGRLLRDVLSFDRRAGAVFAVLPDVGSRRAIEIAADLERRLEPERAALRARGPDGALVPGSERFRLSLTGIFAISAHVHETLVGGLLSSFGIAVATSLAVFTLALRSWRLGLLALVPNLLPMVLTIGFMGLAGISLKPSTVIAFSVTLTIADDDTIQFLALFRALLARAVREGAADPHDAATRRCMRQAGLPMFVTACAVAAGFASLLFSDFLGLANLGLLIGVSLFLAVFSDLFLTPLLILQIRPKFRELRGFEARDAVEVEA